MKVNMGRCFGRGESIKMAKINIRQIQEPTKLLNSTTINSILKVGYMILEFLAEDCEAECASQ